MKKVGSSIIVLMILMGGLIHVITLISFTVSADQPIFIDGNADFAAKAAQEGWPGEGTESNPYIIEDYIIYAYFANGIDIRNTDVYFVIRNSNIHEGGSNFNGIYFRNVENGAIEKSEIYNNHDGINFYLSRNNRISDNEIHNNIREGIYFESSCNSNIIHNNSVYSNDMYGIYLYSNCNSNTISNNSVLNNHYGIVLNNEYEPLIDSNNTITNNTVYLNDYNGIYVGFSPGNTVSNNNASSNDYYGINLYYSSRNIISNNSIHSNEWHGIYLWESSNNTISKNRIYSNNYHGIHLWASSNNYIIDNIFTNDGLFIDGEADRISHFIHEIPPGNLINGEPLIYYKNREGITIDGITVGGIILVNCSLITINNVGMAYTDVGIELGYSNSIRITNSSFSNNYYGIYLQKSSGNTLSDNDVLNNEYGIIVWSSPGNVMTANSIYSNNWYGIYLEWSTGNSIAYNSIHSNNRDGIVLRSTSDGNIISNNNVSNNNGGIWLRESCKYNTIDNNTIHSNDGYGVFIRWCSNNTVIYNNITCNTEYGIYMESSEQNNILHNNFINNIAFPQAYDNGNNTWNNTYPSGGNYWSDLDEPGEDAYDDFQGENQDMVGSDGIVDNGSAQGGGKNPYIISEYDQDNYPLIRPVKFDNSPPIIELISPSNNSIIRSGTTIDFSISDPNLYEVTYTVNDGPTQSLVAPYDILTTEWEDESHVIDITAKDTHDNVAALWFSFTIDSTPPEIMLNSPENNSIIPAATVIDVSVSDTNLDSVFYSIDDGAWEELNQPYDIITDTWIDDNYIVTLNASDLANNFKVTWYNFTIDSSPPAIELNSPPNNTYIKSNVEINLLISDANLNTVTYSKNEGPFELLTPPYIIETNDWQDKEHTLTIHVEDLAGNSNENWFIFIKDSKLPIITLNSPSNNSNIGEGVEIRFTISDANLNHVTYSKNGDAPRLLTQPYIIDTNEWPDGEYTISIYADDLAGNINEKWFKFKKGIPKDFTLPEISLNSPENNSLLTDVKILDFEVSDNNLDSVSYFINQGKLQTLEAPYDLDTTGWEDGTYTITIRALDVAGNVNEKYFVISIDFTSPSVISTQPDNAAIDVLVNTEVIIEFSEPMDIESVEPAISIIPYTEYTYSWSNDDKTLTLNATEPFADGTLYQISISTKAKDLAGHRLENKYVFEFTTKQKPEEKDEGEETSTIINPFILLLLIVIVAIIIIVVGVLTTRKKDNGHGMIQSEGFAQQNAINISCPDCGYMFNVTKTEGPIDVQCPSCGIKGTLE
ncbi:MAG: right-handed parallel beta-helix repeat-containing protein [Thermoplasmata archaeon]|nr:MAG: right-handed parallel beta-helix repeat-containing protein [Thermoplasmata archaeon]